MPSQRCQDVCQHHPAILHFAGVHNFTWPVSFPHSLAEILCGPCSHSMARFQAFRCPPDSREDECFRAPGWIYDEDFRSLGLVFGDAFRPVISPARKSRHPRGVPMCQGQGGAGLYTEAFLTTKKELEWWTVEGVTFRRQCVTRSSRLKGVDSISDLCFQLQSFLDFFFQWRVFVFQSFLQPVQPVLHSSQAWVSWVKFHFSTSPHWAQELTFPPSFFLGSLTCAP